MENKSQKTLSESDKNITRNIMHKILNFMFLLVVIFSTIALVALYYFLSAFLNVETISQFVTIVRPHQFESFLKWTKYGLLIFGFYKYLSTMFSAVTQLSEGKKITEDRLNTINVNG